MYFNLKYIKKKKKLIIMKKNCIYLNNFNILFQYNSKLCY